MTAENIRVRFAPSPTGPFHIGGARSALFNWLLAKKTGGTFVLRIEDTDRERSSKESEENIKAALRWLGMDWNEGVDVGGPNGPYRQMERLDLYRRYTEQLIAQGSAYYCYCTDEELEAERQALLKDGKMPRYGNHCRSLTEEQIAAYKAEGRKPTVRFRVPAGQAIVVDDAVRGRVTFESDGIGDFVIVKSDGIPTYNYAVVIDDALMKITHVIRAEEHLSNTPRQILVYEALGFQTPVFGHISLILGKDRSKMSKRHGATSVDQYRQLGYLPEALVNFLSLLGWSPSGEEELLPVEEIIRQFSLEHVAKNPAVFDVDKLNWINQHYLRKLSDEAFAEMCLPHLVQAGLTKAELTEEEKAWAVQVLALVKEQVAYAAQAPEAVKLFFTDDFDFETPEAADVLKEETAAGVLALFSEKLQALETVDSASVQALLKGVVKESKLGGKKVYMPVRVAITGCQHGPELTHIIPLLGTERVLKRLQASLAKASV